MTEPTPLYVCKDLQHSYRSGKTSCMALQSIDLSIAKNSFLCLTGPSGSGKSTLLALLGLMEPIQAGSIAFCGEDVSSLTGSRLSAIRREKLGFIFQNFYLIDVLSAEENVEFFLVRAGIPKAERRLLVDKALDTVGLSDHRRKRPMEMSGGQRQRVAIARALAKNPDVVIADEPTASLDQKTGRGIMELFAKLHADHGATIVMSSHDQTAVRYAHEVLTLSDGLIQSQPTDQGNLHAS